MASFPHTSTLFSTSFHLIQAIIRQLLHDEDHDPRHGRLEGFFLQKSTALQCYISAVSAGAGSLKNSNETNDTAGIGAVGVLVRLAIPLTEKIWWGN